MHKSYIEELDLSQQRAYGIPVFWCWLDAYYKKYKVYDISPEEVKQRSENDMAGQYKKESDSLEKVLFCCFYLMIRWHMTSRII